MLRSLVRWCFQIVVAGALCGPGLAQGPKGQAQMPPPPIAQKPAPYEPRVPVPEYAFAFLGTILILLILCMPSRKG